MEMEFDNEPVIEEIDPREYEDFKLKHKNGKKFIGYYFNCIECSKEGYLHNKDQLFCPRCGVPFCFQGLGQKEELSKCYEKEDPITKNFNQLHFIADTEADVKDSFKHLIEEDIITDMEEN